MANLLATKPLDMLMKEAQETGEHSLKRTLARFSSPPWEWAPSSAPASSSSPDWARTTPARASCSRSSYPGWAAPSPAFAMRNSRP